MTASLSAVLETVRRVLEGEITREQLALRSSREQVYAAAAIMLVVRAPYLDEDNRVMGHYSHVLAALVLDGTDSNRFGGNLTQMSQVVGLHIPTPGRGGLKPIVLQPPPQLLELTRKLGRTPAVETFLHDVQEGARRQERRNDVLRARLRAHSVTANREDRLALVVAAVQAIAEEFGEDGLRELKARLEPHLGPLDS